MGKPIISNFNERPKTRLAYWSFGLSIIAIMSGPILGIFAAIIRPAINKINSEEIGMILGFGFGIVIISLILVDFVFSIISYKRGGRSWATWIALIFSLITLFMLIFLIIGEITFSH